MTSNTTIKIQRGFRGHIIASNNDSSILLARSLTESLIRNQKFDRSDVLAGYLYAVSQNANSFDKITTKIYQLVREDRVSTEANATLTRQSLMIDSDAAAELSLLVDSIYDGQTATCEPSKRSFPLAFCPFISDDDLYDVSLEEAALTHSNPLAGQVAGLVNVICRALLKRTSWEQAVANAFKTPRLSQEVASVNFIGFRTYSYQNNSDPSYAIEVLYKVLKVINDSKTFQEAISSARNQNNCHILPLVGLLAGVQSDSDQGLMGDTSHATTFDTMRSLIDNLGSQWPNVIVDIRA